MDNSALAFDNAPVRAVSKYEEAVVERVMREFGELVTFRSTTATHWEEIAELIWPETRNTFQYGNYNWPGSKKTDRQVDATGMMALSRFAAILDSLLTPRNSFWQTLRADDDYVMKDRATAIWFEQATKTLFKHRYSPIGNFSSQNQLVWKGLGAFGTGSMFVEAAYTALGERGVRYKHVPVGEMFLKENYQGLIDAGVRWFRLTPRQAMQRWPETFPPILRAPLKMGTEMTYNFLHYIAPRDPADYDPERLDEKGKPFESVYVSIEGHCMMSEGGYHSFPIPTSRYEQSPGEVYGRSPAMSVLPALKTLNAQKRTFLKQGHRAADPVLLTADDGLIDFSLRPGALNKGGVSPDGKPLVHVLPSGQIQIAKEMMQEERQLINDAFLVSLFQILTETPTMTATEVIERTNEKGILMAPTVGRQEAEYLAPMTQREIDVLSMQGLLPPMPPRLKEARGSYKIVSTSPMAKAMRAGEAAGLMRAVESTKELVAITQDQSLLDPYDFDVISPAIAEIQSVPASWMATPEKIAAKRQARAQAQQRQEQIQAAPAQAAMMKAQAVAAKANGGQPPQQGQPAPPQQSPGGP